MLRGERDRQPGCCWMESCDASEMPDIRVLASRKERNASFPTPKSPLPREESYPTCHLGIPQALSESLIAAEFHRAKWHETSLRRTTFPSSSLLPFHQFSLRVRRRRREYRGRQQPLTRGRSGAWRSRALRRGLQGQNRSRGLYGGS